MEPVDCSRPVDQPQQYSKSTTVYTTHRSISYWWSQGHKCHGDKDTSVKVKELTAKAKDFLIKAKYVKLVTSSREVRAKVMCS